MSHSHDYSNQLKNLEGSFLTSHMKKALTADAHSRVLFWIVKPLLHVTFVFASGLAHSHTCNARPCRDSQLSQELCTLPIWSLCCVHAEFVASLSLMLLEQPSLHCALWHFSWSNGCSYVLLICINSDKQGEAWLCFCIQKTYISMWHTFCRLTKPRKKMYQM